MTAQGHTGKAYHRFWAEGRSLVKPEPEDAAAPLWVGLLGLLIGAAIYIGMLIGMFWLAAHVWFKVQHHHIDLCAEYGGKMSIGAFYYVSCYDLTPKKKGE